MERIITPLRLVAHAVRDPVPVHKRDHFNEFVVPRTINVG